jgi:hypothetical protein
LRREGPLHLQGVYLRNHGAMRKNADIRAFGRAAKELLIALKPAPGRFPRL